MIVLVYDNQIAGTSDSLEYLPSGFTAYEVPNQPLEQLYFDGIEVRTKPEQPDPSAYWVGDRWVIPTPPDPIPVYEPFSNSPLFHQAWEQAQTDVKTLAIFATALYADTKGDQQLLQHCQTQLEAILNAAETPNN